MNPLDRLLERLDGVYKSGAGWIARCPAHEDGDPSLSISVGDDGRGLIRCHAGCPPDSVVGAVGLELRDLFSDDNRRRNGRWHQHQRQRPAGSSARDWEAEASRFRAALTDELRDSLAADLNVASTALDAVGLGWHEGRYTIPERDGAGRVIGIATRTPTGAKRCMSGSRRGLVVPHGLANLPDPVLVVEGPSDVAAATSLGLTAVGRPSNIGGADYLAELLRDRETLIVGENDGPRRAGPWPGRDGAKGVAGELATAWRRAVEWTLPPAGTKDLRAWLKARVESGLDLDDEDARRVAGEELLRDLQAETVVESPTAGTDGPPHWEPFPIEALPPVLRRLTEEGAAAIGCDPAFLALSALVACAGAIGLARAARVKAGWAEPSILWGITLGASSSRKDPALDLTLGPLREIDAAARRAHARAMREYKQAVQVHARDLTRWKRADGDGAPPENPTPPRRTRILAQDTTVEALGRLLAETPRSSILVVRREASAWIRAWGEYKGGGGADAERWLELHGGRFPSVDRVSAGEVHVDRCAVSLVGAVPPGKLRRVLSTELLESGFGARVLFAHPPTQPRRWTDAVVLPETGERYAEVVGRLHALRPEEVVFDDGETGLRPREVPLSCRARALFSKWVNELGDATFGVEEAEQAAGGKLEGGAVRLALILELAEEAERGDPAAVEEIGAEAMGRGIRLARWFLGEARRVLALLTGVEEDPRDRERRELIEWIRARGGSCTARELARGPRKYRASGAAELALEALATAGLGTWQLSPPPEGGGHQERRFVLGDDGDTRPPDAPGNAPPDDEWEEL